MMLLINIHACAPASNLPSDPQDNTIEANEPPQMTNTDLDNRLKNIWVVEEMDGQKIDAADFSAGLPTLEFFPGEGRVSGHDGCNRLFGKIISQNGDLKFTVMGSTRMACPNMKKSDQFQKLISDQSFTYSIESRQLVLKQGNKVVMRLKNVD